MAFRSSPEVTVPRLSRPFDTDVQNEIVYDPCMNSTNPD
jgi:hypothetical protein